MKSTDKAEINQHIVSPAHQNTEQEFMKSTDKAESNQHIVSPASQNSEQEFNSNFTTLLHVQLHVTLHSYSVCKKLISLELTAHILITSLTYGHSEQPKSCLMGLIPHCHSEEPKSYLQSWMAHGYSVQQGATSQV